MDYIDFIVDSNPSNRIAKLAKSFTKQSCWSNKILCKNKRARRKRNHVKIMHKKSKDIVNIKLDRPICKSPLY